MKNRYEKAQTGLAWILLAMAGILVVSGLPRPKTDTSPIQMISRLINATPANYRLPGAAYQTIRPLLPEADVYSLITDTPYGVGGGNEEVFLIAQNRLAPILINQDPGELYAIFYCSSHTVAVERAAENGYQLIHDFKDGKGIGVKIQ